MASFLQPISLDTQDSVEDAFIAPPANVFENKEAMEEEEKRLLYDDFRKCGLFPEARLTGDALISRLRSSQRSYDEEMLRRIYAALASYKASPDQTLTAGIFVEAYMKRRRELIAVLETARGEVESAELMLQQAGANINNLAKVSSVAAVEDSKLTVQIVSLRNLGIGSSPCATSGDMFKIHLECQQQVIETQAMRVNEGSCFFNEVFSFEISRREGSLRLCLVRVDPFSGSEELVGDCFVLLDDLADQKKKELTKDVWGHSGEVILSCQWIYAKKSLYENYMQEFFIRREMKLREISDYQIELDKLNRPFCAVDDRTSGLCGWFFRIPGLLSEQMDDLKSYLKLPGWRLTSQYIVALTFFLSGIAGYSRCVFLDQIMAAFTFWNNIDPQRWTVKRYNVLMLYCPVGIAFDFWWFRNYFKAWTIGSVESDIHNITKIFSIFLCVWKVTIFMLTWKCRHDLRMRLTYNQQPNSTTCVYAAPPRSFRSGDVPNHLTTTGSTALAALPLLKGLDTRMSRNRVGSLT